MTPNWLTTRSKRARSESVGLGIGRARRTRRWCRSALCTPTWDTTSVSGTEMSTPTAELAMREAATRVRAPHPQARIEHGAMRCQPGPVPAVPR